MINLSDYTRQSLPDDDYLRLLGASLCVFNSNNAFLIENILKLDEQDQYDWYELIDLVSGKLAEKIKNVIAGDDGDEVHRQFIELVKLRNRIIHSFTITNAYGEQSLATKEKTTHVQFEINKEYLIEFLTLNQNFSDLLHNIRGY